MPSVPVENTHVAPVRERGLKFKSSAVVRAPTNVAPVRERGLKYAPRRIATDCRPCRSREGAWIEIYCAYIVAHCFQVAPVRERGLKYVNPPY